MKCLKCQHENPADAAFCSRCAAPLPSFPGLTETAPAPLVRELVSGQTFAGRYQVIEELGHGGMGRVYKVFDTDIREKIALKLLRPEIALDKETVERFSNELKLARKISHRNVCRMFDLGKAEGTTFITMEFVAGEDLKKFIRKSGQIGAGRAVSIGKQLCEGLAEAHHLGVVHRDLKPQNVMVDEDGNARIMDFGIARSLRGKGITGAGVMIGTPDYMSPEQVEGKEVDARSDIYSLGIILYEMLTGRVPFEGDTPFTIGVKHKSELPRDPLELNAQIPPDLGRLVLKCLEKDKVGRYQSASELRADLEKVERGLPTTARVVPQRRPMSSREITVKFRPNKLILPGLALIGVVIAAVVLPRLLSRKTGTPATAGKPSLAVVYFENKTGDESLDEWSTGIPDLLITDLSQSRLLRVLSGDKIFSVLKRLGLQETRRYSTDDLVRVANEGAAEYTVSGSFIKAGSQFLISATLQKPRTEEVIRNIRVECPALEEITAKVDELTRQLKAELSLSDEQIASDLDKNLGKITSTNAEALRYYIEAKRYHWKGESSKSIPLLEKAVALDPEFILAYDALSSAHYRLSEFALSDSYTAHALELIKGHPDRITDKDRYRIEGRHYYYDLSDQFWPKAEEELNKVLDIDPEDSVANYDLCGLYSDLEQWDRALIHGHVGLKNKFEDHFLYVIMAEAFRAKAMPDKARETLEFYLENVSDSSIGHLYLGLHYITQGELELARREAETGAFLDPTNWPQSYAAGVIAFLEGEFVQAEKEFARLLAEKAQFAQSLGHNGLRYLGLAEGKFGRISQSYIPFIERMRKAGEKDNECSARRRLASVYMKSGEPGKALEECRKAWAVAAGLDDLLYLRDILYLEGQAHLEMGNIPEAEKAAEELKAVNARGMLKDVDIRIYDHLMGRIELEKKNYDRAIKTLKKAVDSLPLGPLETDASYVDSLALAYFRAGDLAKARTEYERITAMTTGRLEYGDIYAKSFYRLGQICEKQGEKAKARENYTKFLELWKDADPGFSQVADAQKRLAALKN